MRVFPMCIQRHCHAIALIAISLLPVDILGAQAGIPAVSLPSTYLHELHSHINGRDYRVMVAVPPGYGGAPDDTTHFPVLYMLDGGVSLPLVSSMYRHGNMTSIEPIILVGIGWGSGPIPSGSGRPPPARTEDFTPTMLPQSDSLKTGGAAVFARVLREEIIPFVERTYRTTKERGILGNSYGALFEVYTLLEHPDLFQKYVIGSPSLWWDNGVMFARESQFARANRQMQKRIYLAVGSEESDMMKDVATRFADSLRAHHYEGLELTTEILAGEGHNGVVTAWRGLQTLYPYLATCTLRRDGAGIYRGRCTRANTLVAQVSLKPPSRQSPTLWRGSAKFAWRPQEEPSAVDMRKGGSIRAGTEWIDVRDVNVDSSGAVFTIDVDRRSLPTRVDLAILRRAKGYLVKPSQWDRSATPDSLITPARPFGCPKSTTRTLFCALYDASVAEAGEYWHGRPAINAVRDGVAAASKRPLRHPLFDINSDPTTTLTTLQNILADAEKRVQRQMAVANDRK